MQQAKRRLIRIGGVASAALLAATAAAPAMAQSVPAARVDFAIGDVAVLNMAGQSRPLAKGAQVGEGETINTNNGRAQLRFTDGAYVSLQPRSEFRIDQYRFEGRQDGSERTFLSLLKGGLRTITGAVGRTNRKNYQVTTTVATIGIRGTEYTVQYGESISGTVGGGEIVVCNSAGCENVSSGGTFYVADQNTPPQVAEQGSDVPHPAQAAPEPEFRHGDSVNPFGFPCALSSCGGGRTGQGQFISPALVTDTALVR